MKRLRKESEQEGNAKKTEGCWTSDAGEPRNHDDQYAPFTRVIGRAHLKPLLVTRSSSDVEIFDRFILQLLRAKGIGHAPMDRRQVSPVVCLMPFRPMFVSTTATSSGGQSTIDGTTGIWQISPVSVRSYIEDLLTQPVLLETFIARGRDLGLPEVRQSLLHDELVQIIHLLEVAAAEDLASLQSEERKMLREMRRKRCAAAKLATKMKEATAAAAAAAGDASAVSDASEECLPRCEDLIVIGIGIGKLGSQKEKDDLEKRGSSDDALRRRGKGGRSDGGGEAGVDEQGDGRGVRQGEGTGDASLMESGGRKKKKKKAKKKKKKKLGKGGSEDSGGSEEGDEGEEEEEEEEHEKVEKETEGDAYDDAGDYDDSELDDEDDWDDKLIKDDDGQSADNKTPEGTPLPTLGALALPRGSMFHRGSMYSLQFTPAFVFSYFPTMPPHYIDEANLAMLIERINRRTALKKSK